jgi:hypothetical protein
LLLQLRRLQLHRIVKFLDAEHRTDTSDHGRLLEWLGEIIVAACLEAIDDVACIGFGGHQDDGYEGKCRIGLEFLENRDAVELRHHDVEQDKIGLELSDAPEGLLAVNRGNYLVSLRVEANPQHF